MKIKVAFDKSTGDFPSVEYIMSKIIMWSTKSKYAHVEVIIKDKWISAKSNGVHVYELRPLSDKWDYVEVEVDGRRLRSVMKFIDAQVGKNYDYIGAIIGGGTHEAVQDKDKWFCSELVSEILKRFSVDPFAYLLSSTLTPEDVHNILVESV